MLVWRLIQPVLSYFTGNGQQRTFVAVSKESRANFAALAKSQADLIKQMSEDLKGLRQTLLKQDEQINALRIDNRRLHEQHLNCEANQRKLEARIEELEREVAGLRGGT